MRLAYQRVIFALQFPYKKHQKKLQCKTSVTPRFTMKSLMMSLAYRFKHFLKRSFKKPMANAWLHCRY